MGRVIVFLAALVVVFFLGSFLLRAVEERRAVADFLELKDEVKRLEATQATTEQVRAALGPPDHALQRERKIVWFYDIRNPRGRRELGLVIDFDLEHQRVISTGYTVIN